MKVNYRSVLAVALSCGLTLQAPVVAFATEGETPQSGSSNQIGYEVGFFGFDVYGIDGDKTHISSTCGNGGYKTVEGDEQTQGEVSDDYISSNTIVDEPKIELGKEYDPNGDQVTTTITAQAQNNAVLVTYELENKSGEQKTVRIGSAGDTQVYNNDRATVSFLDSGTGVQMVDPDSGYKFVVLPNGDDFDTLWYGAYSGHTTHVFDDKNRENATSFENQDSAVAWSWEVTLAANEVARRTAVLGIGDIDILNVSYNPGEGTGTMSDSPFIKGFTGGVTLKENQFVKEGYDFDGWATSSDSTTVAYQDKATIEAPSTNLQLYALWKVMAATNPSITIQEVAQQIIETKEETFEAAIEQVAQEVQAQQAENDYVTSSTEGINIITTEQGNTLPTSELGNAVATTKTVTLDIQKITPVQYRDVVKTTVQTVPVGGVAVIETNDVSVLDRNIIAAMEARPDVAINIVFKHDGVKKRVVIPAGYNVRLLLDDNGFCGYLKLAEILGFTILEEVEEG